MDSKSGLWVNQILDLEAFLKQMDNFLLNRSSVAKPPTASALEFSATVESGENFADAKLQLNSPSSSVHCSSKTKGTKRMWSYMNGIEGSENPVLALCLGQPQDSFDIGKMSSKRLSTPSLNKSEEVIDLGLTFQLSHDDMISLNPSKSIGASDDLDLHLSLSVAPSESITTISILNHHLNNLETSAMLVSVPTNDEEGIVSSCGILSNCMEHRLHNSESSCSVAPSKKFWGKFDQAVVLPDFSPKVVNSGVANLHAHHSSIKNCQFQGCAKRARGASGLCIAHGGGRRCQKHGCQKGAEGKTIFCKAHGGGRRCERLGCTKSAEGRTDYCIAHGGGQRCGHESCSRAARGKSGLCIRHGGGKRCQRENCARSAEGYSGFCISHGGGRRCQFPKCSKGAQGSTMFCKAHGGGKRCTFLGCTKGAEGSTSFCKGHGGGKRCSFQGGGVCTKSVHGGTLFCVAHGGGKRCAAPGCTKSARGRTSFCVRHGGGKRCKFEGCDKSAQGSTDFCKAHGGGKRCVWGRAGSKFSDGDSPCDKFARTKAGLCSAHDALVQDYCVRGGGTLAKSSVQYPTHSASQNLKAVAIKGSKEVPGGNGSDTTKHSLLMQCGVVSLPEGRVHGGSLLTLLASSSGMGSHI